MTANRVTKPIDLTPLDHESYRADVELWGLDHSEQSYEGRIFLDNPHADENTSMEEAEGYAGSFHIFGHGGCFGDEGHCNKPTPRRLYDPRPAHPLTPRNKTVIATPAIKRIIAQGKADTTITVVAVLPGVPNNSEVKDPLRFDRLAVVTYR
jgi:hypothetical protein